MMLAYRLFLRMPQFGRMPQGSYLERVEQSPHFIKGKFRNIERITTHMSLDKVPTLIKQNRNIEIEKRPLQDLPVDFSALSSMPKKESGFQFTWFGHSALMLEIDGLRILIDPMLGRYASPVPGMVKRFSDTSAIDWKNLLGVDLVLFSHDHYDHLDYGSFKRIRPKTRQFLCSLGVASHLRFWGLDEKKIAECDWGEHFEFGSLKFYCCPTRHFSGRSPKGRDTTLWSSWVIESRDLRIFFSSDSGYFSGFKQLGERFGEFDLAFIECGQYNTLWKENHMMPEESFQAFRDIKARYMVPIHWGAFSLAPHDWRDPVRRLMAAADQYGIANRIITPLPGQRVAFEDELPRVRWWEKEKGQINALSK